MRGQSSPLEAGTSRWDDRRGLLGLAIFFSLLIGFKNSANATKAVRDVMGVRSSEGATWMTDGSVALSPASKSSAGDIAKSTSDSSGQEALNDSPMASGASNHSWAKISQDGKSLTCKIDHRTALTLPMVPSFIIAGVQKGGTTALYNMLKLLPGILPTRALEAHFFDNYCPTNLDEKTPEERCMLFRNYVDCWDADQLQANPSMTFEKTPKCLGMPHVAKLISEFFPRTPKVIIVLRDPVARAYSHYKMSRQNSGPKNRATFPSFEDTIWEAMAKMRKGDVIQAPELTYATAWNSSDFQYKPIYNQTKQKGQPKWGNYLGEIDRGIYVDQLLPWLHCLGKDNIKFIQYEKFERQKLQTLKELLEFVGSPNRDEIIGQLDPTKLEEDFSPNQRAKASFVAPPLTNKTKRYLKHFYKPYNDTMADVLGEEWRGVWD